MNKILLVFLLFLSVNFNSTAQTKTGFKTLTINDSKPGKTITVKESQVFDVLFKDECIGCRFSWELAKHDSTSVKFVKESFKSNVSN